GNLGALQWLRGHGCEWGKHVFTHAAVGGHLEFIKWAQAQGCLFERLSLQAVAQN
ncbi:hypothetical protein T492DRAFT_574935, partial [Pavlovales sp. CCMP2436]